MTRPAVLLAASFLLTSRLLAQTASAPPPADISRLAWLAGSWAGEQGTGRFEETWTTPAGGAMLAVSRTLKGGRMSAFEFLRIVEKDGTLVYVAQPSGRPPTEFPLTAIDGKSATFENRAHDFPKMIRYAKRPDGGIEARVSDGGTNAETYVYRRAR